MTMSVSLESLEKSSFQKCLAKIKNLKVNGPKPHDVIPNFCKGNTRPGFYLEAHICISKKTNSIKKVFFPDKLNFLFPSHTVS